MEKPKKCNAFYILEKSFLLYNQDVDFKIFVADELFDVSENSLPNNVYEAKKILKNVFY